MSKLWNDRHNLDVIGGDVNMYSKDKVLKNRCKKT